MKRIVRLTESDLTRIVRRVIMEQRNPQALAASMQELMALGASANKEDGVNEVTINMGTIRYDLDCSGKLLYSSFQGGGWAPLHKDKIGQIQRAVINYCKVA
jgi:hypothetical protein